MYYFESHITIEVTSEVDVEKFKKICEELKVKHIIINLGSDTPKQVMTSHTFRSTTLKSAIEVVKEQSNTLQVVGFKVLREKLEAEPRCVTELGLPYHYAETHLLFETSKLVGKVLPACIHKSSNEFKEGFTFLTYRTTKDIDSELLELFKEFPFLSLFSNKLEIEYAVYDSNEDLDAKWMSNGSIKDR